MYANELNHLRSFAFVFALRCSVHLPIVFPFLVSAHKIFGEIIPHKRKCGYWDCILVAGQRFHRYPIQPFRFHDRSPCRLLQQEPLLRRILHRTSPDLVLPANKNLQ